VARVALEVGVDRGIVVAARCDQEDREQRAPSHERTLARRIN
jgi:hypothetical protein